MTTGMRLQEAFVRLAGVILALSLLTRAAAAQDGIPLVRNVDERARALYNYTINASCIFPNVCMASFPTVPEGKRLRVTSVTVFAQFQSSSGFLALNLDYRGNPILAFPVAPIGMAYYGSSLSSSFQTDNYFEAGQTPILELGTWNNWNRTYLPRLTVTGYMVDVAP